jgi:hypothetical protein
MRLAVFLKKQTLAKQRGHAPMEHGPSAHIFSSGYLMAWGLIGDPVPRVMTSGGADRKNS